MLGEVSSHPVDREGWGSLSYQNQFAPVATNWANQLARS
uniref:Uncharacterized protein n=1 Tax=Anguilla anguilla TaxID=7936 RepID=A0A0E9VKS5_ANGAN